MNVQLTMEDVAYILGVTRGTIYNRIKAGEYPAGDGMEIVQIYLDARRKETSAIEQRLKERAIERWTSNGV